MKIVSVGEITHDYYPDIDKSFIGGISLNFAVQAKRSGAEEVALISRVGSDEPGNLVLADLLAEGVDARHVQIVEGETGKIDIAFREDGDRYFPAGSYHLNALENMKLTAEELSFVQGHDVYMANFGYDAFKVPFDQLMSMPFAGWRASDFGDVAKYDGKLPDGHLAAIGQLDLAFLSGGIADREWFKRAYYGRTLVILTMGAAGSCALSQGRLYEQAALPVEKMVDPTGCGDAFQAAFLVAYWKTQNIARSLKAGAERAATVLGHYGAH